MPTTGEDYRGFTLTIGKRWENRLNHPCTDKLAHIDEKSNETGAFA
jgi:hypothetical protein